MTYTTTPIICGQAIRADLLPRAPRRPIPDLKRRMYVTKDVSRILDGGQTDTHFADERADALLANYLAGFNVRVSRKRREWPRGREPFLERLVGEDDVWVFCFRTPRPGWRLFGRFLERDVFVGLKMLPKHEVLAAGYPECASQTVQDWRERFADIEPHRGSEICDYLGHMWTDIDNDDL